MADDGPPIDQTRSPERPTDAHGPTDEPAASGPVAFAETLAGDSDRIARALSDRSDPFAATIDGSGDFGPATLTGMAALNYKVGELISGRYAVTGVLGQGGFAVVYAARDQLVDRRVAVKVLNTFADAVDEANTHRAVERFQREARAAAMITHPNVVTIYDLGLADRFERPFIVMELLEGHDLAHELKASGPMAPARALRLFAGALAGLAAGHARGIVHKDLKPANLFLTAPGTADEKLSLFDFGIARLGEGEAGLTKTGEMFGTPQYMAPEYIAGGRVSPALDVYQMGLILVEMFTGRKVIEADVAITAAMAHGKGELPLPVELLHGRLGEVVRRALAHDPEARFADAGAFAEALAEVRPEDLPPRLSGDTRLLNEAPDPSTLRLRAATVDGLEPVPSLGGRRRGPLLAVAALLVMAVGGWWALRVDSKDRLPPPPPTPVAVVAPPVAPAAPDVAPPDAIPPDASAPDASAPVVVRLEVEPAGAVVELDGEPVPDGRVVFAGPDAAARALSIRAAGFEALRRPVAPTDGPTLRLALQPSRPAAPPPQPAAADPQPVKVHVAPQPTPPPEVTVIPPPPEPEPDPEPVPEPEPSGAVILD